MPHSAVHSFALFAIMCTTLTVGSALGRCFRLIRWINSISLVRNLGLFAAYYHGCQQFRREYKTIVDLPACQMSDPGTKKKHDASLWALQQGPKQNDNIASPHFAARAATARNAPPRRPPKRWAWSRVWLDGPYCKATTDGLTMLERTHLREDLGEP